MPSDKWSAEEEWVWAKIRAEEIADFNIRLGKELDPRKPDGWNNDRKIGAQFLKKIFFEKPYQEEIPSEGVRIVGAFLPEGQVLQSGSINRTFGSINVGWKILLTSSSQHSTALFLLRAPIWGNPPLLRR